MIDQNKDTTGGRADSLGAALDWILLPSFSFFSALLLGAIGTSLYHARTIANSGGTTDSIWQFLNNSAGFWNGHFGAISLVFLAWGLYLQARAIRNEARAELEQAAVTQADFRRWLLETLLARRIELAERMEAIVAWQEDTAEWQASRFQGHAVATRLHDDFSAIASRREAPPLMNVREKEARAYLELLKRVTNVIQTGPTQERGALGEALSPAADQTSLEKILAYIDSERKELDLLIRKAAPDAEYQDLKAKAETLFNDGWRLEIRNFRTTQVLTARRASFSGDICEADEIVTQTQPVHKCLRILLAALSGNSIRRQTILNKHDQTL